MIPTRASFTGQSYKIFDDYNDFHIFVEDSGFENLYRVLFKKYGLKVDNIFSKNGREAVLKAANFCSDPKCVYIVDRDWDDFSGSVIESKNVVVLRMHSIENYLIDYDAFAGVLIAENPKCNLDSVLSKQHFDNILSNISIQLKPLFECFLSMQICDNSQKNCSHKPGSFQQKNRSCSVDNDLIIKFIENSNVVVPQEVKDYFADDLITEKGHGKFMLHFFWQGIRNSTKISKIHTNKLLIRLAQLIDNHNIESIISEVRSKAQANNALHAERATAPLFAQ